MLLLAVHVHFLESYCVRDWKVYTSIGNLIFVWWVAVEIWSIWKSKCLSHLCQGVVLWRGCLVRWGEKHPSKKKNRFYKYCPRPKLNVNFSRAEWCNGDCDMVFLAHSWLFFSGVLNSKVEESFLSFSCLLWIILLWTILFPMSFVFCRRELLAHEHLVKVCWGLGAIAQFSCWVFLLGIF